MRTFLIVFLVGVVNVFFKALQNRNYNFNDYWYVMPTSLAISGCELYLLSLYVHRIDWVVWLAAGMGSAIGGMVAMWVHERWIRRS